MVKKIFDIKGMHCNACATLIEKELKDKVNSVSASFAGEKAEIDFDENKISEEEIIGTIKGVGYEANEVEQKVEEENKQEEGYLDSTEKEEINEDEELKLLEERRKWLEQSKKLKEETKKQEARSTVENRASEIKIVTSKAKKEEKKEKSNNLENKKDGDLSNTIGWIVLAASVIALIFVIYKFSGFSIPDIKVPEIGEKTSLLLLFAAGILTGFHCIAMCGGFVVSYTAKNALKGHKGFKQHLVYGGSKLVSYTVIGGIFGLIGGVFAFSIGLRGWIAILAGLFMICYALGMFGIKFFKRFQLNPKFLTKAASEAGASARGYYKAPFVTGILNGLFIACGPLQAMYLFAVGTGSFLQGATSLFAFGLGTLPVMLGFGSLATVISHKTTGKILKMSAIIVLILGLIMLNRGLTLTGSQYSYGSIKASIIGGTSSAVSGNILNGIQEINMQVDASGYSPNSFVLKKGISVKWNVNVEQLTGCNSELVLREYNINARLKKGLNVFEFIPDKAGTFTFSCGMGMLRGSFIVTETGQASQQEIKAATPSSGGSCGGSSGGCGCGG